ncbi:MAG: hypothetical protein B6U72_05095 [Candidatus Altiarchaeales archaeon ex4484_2]|nr:MAG: hypothetical protein B6U72_05095 [Candidatus Altiarchaeales archaeon ex4484_2]
MEMKIESIRWLLKSIKEGKNTAYSLKQGRSTIVYEYLRFAKNYGLVEQYTEGVKKPYKITQQGEWFLKIFDKD